MGLFDSIQNLTVGVADSATGSISDPVGATEAVL